MSKSQSEEGNLQDWMCVKINGFEIFFNKIEKVITFHPPFLLDDLECFLVRKVCDFFYLEIL